MAALGRFLAQFASKLWSAAGPKLISMLIDKVIAWVQARRTDAAKSQARAEREATEKAETPKEREDAHDQNRRL